MVRTLFLSMAMVVASTAAAHEIGTTQVRAELRRDRTYRIDLMTAPQSLLDKLRAAAGESRSPALSAAQLRADLQRRASAIAAATTIRFGERRVIPNVNVLPIVEPADPQEALAVIVRFTGDIPQRAGAFTWQYDLTYASYSLLIEAPDSVSHRQWLEGEERSAPFPVDARLAAPTRPDVIRQYLALGFTHIVPYGLDHILFVLAMFLLTSRVKPVMAQVTAFTIAHSITLALTMYGLVSIPPRIVEPMIAVSIAWVAVENLRGQSLHPSRVAVVFAFGLLHGMGFAGVLRELGLPRTELVSALVSFNVGVELGQFAVIAAAWLLVARWAGEKVWYRPRLVVPASFVIAIIGAVWTVQRLV